MPGFYDCRGSSYFAQLGLVDVTVYRIRLDAQRHAAFLAEQRKDPVTKNPIGVGAEIVICSGDGIAFFADNWPGRCPLCGCTDTLSAVPLSRLPQHLGGAQVSDDRMVNTNVRASRDNPMHVLATPPPTPLRREHKVGKGVTIMCFVAVLVLIWITWVVPYGSHELVIPLGKYDFYFPLP